MSPFTETSIITYDPLSAITRKERTALLGVSMLGVALVKVPLVPEKFAVLGIEFAKVQQQAFVQLYALIVFFYLIAFCIYAITDFVAWRRALVITLHEYNQQVDERKRTEVDRMSDPLPTPSARAPIGLPGYTGFASWGTAERAARMRAAFEFALPALFAGYALCVLLTFKP